MKTTKMTDMPTGCYGLATDAWGDTYAVCARWSDAGSPVYVLGATGWVATPMQVADYRHSPRAALRAALIDAVAVSEGIPSDDVDDELIDAALGAAYAI